MLVALDIYIEKFAPGLWSFFVIAVFFSRKYKY